jgi:hypothetical protein
MLHVDNDGCAGMQPASKLPGALHKPGQKPVEVTPVTLGQTVEQLILEIHRQRSDALVKTVAGGAQLQQGATAVGFVALALQITG